MRKVLCLLLTVTCWSGVQAQQKEAVRITKDPKAKKIDVFVGKRLFTSFLYPDTLEKPVLYPLHAANGTVVTRGFPVAPKPGDPNDHPHHLGLWLNFENVNGLDFWNNSYAIPTEKKGSYGWIKTDKILETTSGPTGTLAYHANWTNQKNEVLLEENTRFEFSGTDRERTIDRVTTLKANTEVTFTDAKDGLLGLRVAHELQIPSDKDEKFTDSKGIVTVVKAGTDKVPNGTFLTSTGKRGNDAWSTRAAWCKMYGKMGQDSVSITILDHPKNLNYPTFWHARGYGLFAANPLGEKIFTNGATAKNLQLKKGESVTFRYRVLIDGGRNTPSAKQLNQAAADFAKKNVAVK
ncbi:PmoA family protein [Hymenobacter tibetensis]|uniref:PmoA family protein n=1 Tax=Hymenobacter tibetensis TaxID=497967 RepID=A0ABY4D1M4_9BACT|nr:PmoA family protein [Hymenobacter tibetensis]UOG76420.1 PmoA family protein [Hymenobacter tibetensis]